MDRFSFGDYVAYERRGGGSVEIGRVVSKAPGGGWFVCYGLGCTAASTPDELLRRATPRECVEASKRQIGYHRFDDQCSEYDEWCCGSCKAANNG